MHGLVLTAAGRSARFGGPTSKVLLDLAGQPVIRHALDAFRTALPDVVVIVTAQAGDLDAMREALPDVEVIEGGATRQASVARGIRALPAATELIFVHDAARPLIDVETIHAVRDAATVHGAAIAAAAVSDSIHACGPATPDGARPLVQPLDRSGLVAAQTPQAARAGLLRRAVDLAEAKDLTATDEAGLLAHVGIEVVACIGPDTNRKITTPLDLDAAAVHLARRSADGP